MPCYTGICDDVSDEKGQIEWSVDFTKEEECKEECTDTKEWDMCGCHRTCETKASHVRKLLVKSNKCAGGILSSAPIIL